MPTYQAPGVYVEEIPSAIKPIAGVGTSTAGFVGLGVDIPADLMPARPGGQRYAQAPAGVPQALSSWEEFRQKFGDFQAVIDGALAAAQASATGEEAARRQAARQAVAQAAAYNAAYSAAYSASLAGKPSPTDRQREAAEGEATAAAQGAVGGDTGGVVAAAAAVLRTIGANQYLAHAVYGFFNNGGTRCWVARVEGAAGVAGALRAFEAIDEIAIVAAPMPPEIGAEALKQVHGLLVAHCQLMEDRVAILDSVRDPAGDNLDIAAVGRPAANPRGFGAFYFPWIEVADPLAGAGARVAVPPSGHIAGIYARSDAQRGVHKAPANEVVMGALGVRHPISKIQQGPLNVAGVNAIRSFNGTVKVYGARTLASDPAGDPEWVYVNVRRLFNFLRESIDEGTQWVVFEPNTPDLWARIRRNIGAFLTTVWSSGALFGVTPEEAFYVRCDETTNPPEVRALGQVVTEIGVAVVRPAEFVIFRISQWAGPGE